MISSIVGLDESVTWRTLRVKVVAVLGDSLEGLGLAEVNDDGDEEVLGRRRWDRASGPNTTRVAICVYVFINRPRCLSPMAMPKVLSSFWLA
jgi:hypothetical protein